MSTLTIYSIEQAELDVLQRVIAKVATMRVDDDRAISVVPRRESGFLEYIVTFTHDEKHTFTLGCVQRSVGAELEFHS